MSKRFSDTEIWRKEWFCNLSPEMKIFWRYILDNCDNCGVWEINMPLAEFQIKAKLNICKILSSFEGNLLKIADNKLLVIDFITFQYGELKEDCVPHRNIFKLLEKHDLPYPIDRVLGISNTLKDKDKEKNKDILSFKEGECEGKQNLDDDWRTSFEIYQSEEQAAYQSFIASTEWVEDRQQYHPRLDIKKSLQKAHADYWSTVAGWKKKKSCRTTKTIDWSATYKNALTMKSNQVFSDNHKKSFGRNEISNEELVAQAQRIDLSTGTELIPWLNHPSK